MTTDSTSVPTTLTEADATRLTTRIQLQLGMIAESTEKVLPLIEEARAGNAHEALGYPSWTAYVADKFGGTLARLGKAERLPLVELMAEQGMSTRAIASVVGVSKDTVSRDLRAGVSGETPAEPEEKTTSNNTTKAIPRNTSITGTDGKTYPSAKASSTREAQAKPEKTEPENIPDEWDGTYSTDYLHTTNVGINWREAQAIQGRWEFGQELLDMRDENGSLPDGYLAAVVKATGKSRTELKYRERLAQRYPTEEMLNAAIEKFGSWDAFIRGDLKREYGGAS